MNEKLQYLIKQVDTDISGRWVLTDNLEKFAELIVLECAKVIEGQDVDPGFKLRMSWAFKQKFGVEE